MSFVDILNTLKDFGLPMVIATVAVYLAARRLNLWLDEMEKRPIPTHAGNDRPLVHSFFSHVLQFIIIDVPTIQIKDDFKRLIATVILTNYWQSITASMTQYIDAVDIDKVDKLVAQRQLAEGLTTGITNAYKILEEQYKVPKIALDRFRKLRKPFEALWFRNIEAIFPGLSTNTMRIFHVLNILNFDLEIGLFYIEDEFEDLNGKLAGVEFMGTKSAEHAGE